MRRLIAMSLSTIGLLAASIAPTIAAINPHSLETSTDIPTNISLSDRFEDSFINGPGSLNSLSDRFKDSFINGPGSLNSLSDRFKDSFINGPGSLNSLNNRFKDSFINGPGGLNS